MMLRNDERGFSLIELVSVTFLIAIMAVAGGFTLRHYWLKRSLEVARSEIVTEMRGAQQRAMAESNPLVYGLRFIPNSGDWAIVRFDPRETALADRCTQVETHTFPGSVIVESVSFTSASPATDDCRSVFGASSQFALFFPRGTATEGVITFSSPFVDGTRSIRVLGITGRVEEF